MSCKEHRYTNAIYGDKSKSKVNLPVEALPSM
jgi:hypothetical protein